MPLFYIIPFKFHPPERPKLVDIEKTDVVLFLLLGLTTLVLLIVFVVIPALIAFNETLPAS